MKTETLEGNKLIAEFMGLIYNPYATGRYGRFWINDKSKGSKKIGAGFKELKYHSSWDWLMPVVCKIQKYRPVFIASQNDTEHHCNIGIGWIEIINKSMVKAVWLAVIEFIKWYNQNNNQ